MKVNTDSLILGSWVRVVGRYRILDIGTGTGILALMLAQRASEEAVIDAIEIDAEAARQARENVLASPWADNIAVCQGSVLTQCPGRQYDLIACNPPYFAAPAQSTQAYTTQSEARQQARMQDSLSPASLFAWVAAYLTAEGALYCLYPADQVHDIVEQGRACGLFCTELLWVQSYAHKPAHVAAMCFTRQDAAVQKETLVIHTETGDYSEDYRRLCRPYYLKF